MGLTRFETLSHYFYIKDNNYMKQRGDVGYDPLFKIRPLLDHVRTNCTAVIPEARQCVDEQMEKFKGRSHLKQYLPKKPTKWGYKIIARCGSSGIIYDLHIQGDKFTPPQPAIGFCGDIVLHLCVSLPPEQPFLVYCDHFYTSLALVRRLQERNIFFVGTIMSNRLKKCPLKSEKELQWGQSDLVVDANSGIMVLKWLDR